MKAALLKSKTNMKSIHIGPFWVTLWPIDDNSWSLQDQSIRSLVFGLWGLWHHLGSFVNQNCGELKESTYQTKVVSGAFSWKRNAFSWILSKWGGEVYPIFLALSISALSQETESIPSKMPIIWTLNCCFRLYIHNPARVRSARAQRAFPLRALGLLLVDGARTVERGKTFWQVN